MRKRFPVLLIILTALILCALIRYSYLTSMSAISILLGVALVCGILKCWLNKRV